MRRQYGHLATSSHLVHTEEPSVTHDAIITRAGQSKASGKGVSANTSHRRQWEGHELLIDGEQVRVKEFWVRDGAGKVQSIGEELESLVVLLRGWGRDAVESCEDYG